VHLAPNLVRSLAFAPYPLSLLSFSLNSMVCLSMGEGVVFCFLVLFLVCILGYDGEWVELRIFQ